MLLDTCLMEVVRADIHVAYDDNLWTFVPELELLESIEESLRKLLKNGKRHYMDEVPHCTVFYASVLIIFL
jgi:hypothetical protein